MIEILGLYEVEENRDGSDLEEHEPVCINNDNGTDSEKLSMVLFNSGAVKYKGKY